MLLNTIETYKSLQSFSSIDEMNRSVKEHKKLINKPKLKNVYALLDVISQYSCVYFGVCWLCQRKLASKLGVSYKTIQRGFDKLVELNIVTRYECSRSGGDKRQTSNIYVINPIKNECDHVEVSTHESLNLISNNINNTDVTVAPAQSELVKILVNKLPKPLQVLQYYFSMDEIYSIVGTVYKAKSSVDKGISIEEHSFEFENTLKQVIQSYKLGRIRNLNGVVFGAIKKLCTSITLKSRMSEMFGL